MSSFLNKPIKPIDKNINSIKNTISDKSNEDTYLKRVRDKLSSNSFLDAESIALNGYKNYPNNIFIQYAYALTLSKVNKYKESNQLLSEIIKKNSKYQDAIMRLGINYIQLKQYKDAEFNLLKALDLNPNSFHNQNYIVSLYMGQHKYDNVIKHYQKFNKILESNDFVQNCLGVSYIRLGNAEKSLNYFSVAMKLDPDRLEYAMNYANALEFCGHKEKCLEQLEYILDKNILYTDAFRSWCLLNKNVNSSDERVKRILKILKTNKISIEQEIQINQGLWDIYNRENKYELAFNSILKANNLKRSTLNYFSEKTKHEVTKQISYFENYNFKRDNVNKNNKNYIFIVGMPRSGTSLIEQILSSHSKIYGAGELTFFQEYFRETADPDINSEVFLSNSKQKYNEYIKNRIPSDEFKRSQFIIDKLPGNFQFLGIIKACFPESIIIHSQRSMMDLFLSIYTTRFSAGHLYSYNLREINSVYGSYIKIMRFWNKKITDIINLNYEDVVKDTKNEIIKILQHCNLDYEEACLDFYKNKRAVHTASSSQVREKMYTSSINRSEPYIDYINKELQKN